jgi:phosphatidylserine/phosphatidylglycerophosphate/cardiolipin synthase-like enzyme
MAALYRIAVRLDNGCLSLDRRRSASYHADMHIPKTLVVLAVALCLYVSAALAEGPAASPSVRGPIPAGSTFELGFSPGGSATAVVLKAIAAARTSLLLVAYEFSDRDVAEALEAAAHRGVKVRVVADFKAAQARYSQVRILVAAGVPVRLDSRYAITHDKFMVIDGVSVETGSYNYSTAAAKKNAENALVLWHLPELAAAYASEFERLWAESEEAKG